MQATPATAASVAVAEVAGSGTISPPLTPTGVGSHTFTFNSTTITLTGVHNNAPVVNATSICTANGGSVIETYAGGVGTGRWSCSSGILAGRSGWLAYARVGVAVPVVLGSGTITSTPPAPTTGLQGALACVFSPTTSAPGNINSYTLQCHGTGVIVP